MKFTRWLAICSFFFLSFSLQAKIDLRVGDILLLELPCYSCQRIAEETKSGFSHSGLILKNPQGELVVAESLSSVRVVELKSFVKRSTKGATLKVMRTNDFIMGADQLRKSSWELFQTKYQGLLFDDLFLWDRRDQWGREMLYCSEFIAKLLNHFLINPLEPEPMDFSLHWEFWQRYFGRTPPQGELGNSPASFEVAPGWFAVGEFLPDEF